MDRLQAEPHKQDESDGALKIVSWQRRAEVLTRPKLPCLAEFHTINLSAGCPNECRYCYAQSYAHHPGWGTLAFYANAKENLKEELAHMRQPPRLVYFSTASEPFLPHERILQDLFEIMRALLEAGSFLLISTKSVIPDAFIQLFSQHPGKVHVQVGITTLDENVRRMIEPRASRCEQRLDNLARLCGAGVGAEARIDPLVPGLTDTNENLETIFLALARIGVREAVISFLFLRWGIRFPNDLAFGAHWSMRKMRPLYTQKITNYCGGGTIWLPSLSYRAERIAAIESIALENKITLKICRCKNPDLPNAECCHPTHLLTDVESSDDFTQSTLF